MTTGTTKQFTASVSGTSMTGVIWLVNGTVGGNATVGTVSSGGLYTAPAAVPAGTVNVTARSAAYSNQSASASIIVTQPPAAPVVISISISPTTSALQTGATQQFTASVSGTGNSGVDWSVNGVSGGNSTVGTISSGGLYTAPASAPSGSVTVMGQSQADSSKSATASISISAPPALPATSFGAVQAQQNFNIGSGLTSLSAGINSTAGDLLVAFVREGSNNTDNFTVSDDLGQSWTLAGSYNTLSSTNRSAIFYRANSGAVSSVTANFTTSGGVTRPGIVVYEIAGAAASSPLDAAPVANTFSTTQTSITSAPLTTNSTNDILIYAVDLSATQSGTNNSFVPGAGFAFPAIGSANDPRQAVSYEIVASGKSGLTTSMSWATAGAGTSQFIAFRSASSAPLPVGPLALTTGSLPNGSATQPYSATLAASGGTAPYTWSVVSGSLGAGLSLSPSGAISGTPTTAGAYTFSVQVKDSAATPQISTGSLSLTVAPAPPPAPPAGASKFFAPTSFINTPLPASPSIDPNSASMVANSLGAQASAAHLSNGGYAVGLVYANASDKVYSVACTTYDSSTCMVGHSINFPIPKGAIVPSGTDHNTAFIYTANDGSPYAGMEMDCWIAQYNSTNDSWSCGTASLVHNNNTTAWGTCAEGNITSFHCNGGYAAGFDFAAGPIRPEEIQAGVIPHALVMALSNPGSGITCPATHTDHSGSGVPEGGHFFLPASYNVDAQSWPNWVKLVAHALQSYGGYIVDYGGSMEVKGFTDQNPGSISWASVGVPNDQGGDLNMIPWGQMQVVTMQSCN